MNRMRLALRMSLGGAVCGSFLGIFTGGLLGGLGGLLLGNMSLGLDGALLTGSAGCLSGAVWGASLAAREGETQISPEPAAADPPGRRKDYDGRPRPPASPQTAGARRAQTRHLVM
jgi:hypothetical protein